MRSQASGWAAGIAASKCSSRMLRGLATLKAALPEALRASRRGTGGVDDCGTAEEDGPVTWETPERPVGGTGRRRTGDPLRRAGGGKRSDGRPGGGDATRHRTHACLTGKAWPRANRRRAEAAWGVGWLHTSDDGGERARHPDPAEQRRPVLR